MSYGTTTRQIRIGGPITPAVKGLLIANFSIFVVQFFLQHFGINTQDEIFGLSHKGLTQDLYLWQPFTYMFLHGGLLHIIFNMLALWMFAGDLEQAWGTKRFIRYYLLSGVGAGLCIALLNWYLTIRFGVEGAASVTVGASGALYALLLAYGLLWPNREVLIWFILPVKMKYVVIFFGVFEFFGTMDSMSGVSGGISHVGHIGGLLAGFFLFKIEERFRPRPRVKSSWYITKLFRSFRLRRKRSQINTRIRAKETIDILLDKIAHEGMASLTPSERKDLEWARRHYYPSDDETMH